MALFQIDLHTHTRHSDGELSPTALIARAAQRNVSVLALTDHDTTVGLQEAATAAAQHGIHLISGVEISAQWCGQGIHILGLNIEPTNAILQAGLTQLREIRNARAEKISDKMAKIGIPNVLAQIYAGMAEITSEDSIGRLHFARYLVDQNIVKNIPMAFQYYLKRGQPAYVPADWVDMAVAIAWIRQAGGRAVLAHPMRYDLRLKRLRDLLSDFKKNGGAGIEVVTSSVDTSGIQTMAQWATELDLLASIGSDFHGPGISRAEISMIAPLPTTCRPVWYDWGI